MNAAVVRYRPAAAALCGLALPRGADASRLPARPRPAPAALSLLWHVLRQQPVARKEAAWMPC